MGKWGVFWSSRCREAEEEKRTHQTFTLDTAGSSLLHSGQSRGRAAPRSCRQWQIWKEPWVSDIQRMLQKVIKAFHHRVKDKSLRLASDSHQLTTAQREKAVKKTSDLNPFILSGAVLFSPPDYPSRGEMWKLSGYATLQFHGVV